MFGLEGTVVYYCDIQQWCVQLVCNAKFTSVDLGSQILSSSAPGKIITIYHIFQVKNITPKQSNTKKLYF